MQIVGFDGASASQFISVNVHLGDRWTWAECGLLVDAEGVRILFTDHREEPDSGVMNELWREEPAEFEAWYRIRLEYLRDSREFACIANNELIDIHRPELADSFVDDAATSIGFAATREPGSVAVNLLDNAIVFGWPMN
jgi:hypothetical protein